MPGVPINLRTDQIRILWVSVALLRDYIYIYPMVIGIEWDEQPPRIMSLLRLIKFYLLALELVGSSLEKL